MVIIMQVYEILYSFLKDQHEVFYIKTKNYTIVDVEDLKEDLKDENYSKDIDEYIKHLLHKGEIINGTIDNVKKYCNEIMKVNNIVLSNKRRNKMNRIESKLLKKASNDKEIALKAYLEFYDESEAEQRVEEGDWFIFSSDRIKFAKEYIAEFEPEFMRNQWYQFLDFEKYGNFLYDTLDTLVDVGDKIVWIMVI